MEQMTLREVCARAGVSRRAVQGYEKAGLVIPMKNERGYLLYDAHALERIKRIKLYQQFGLRIRQIGDVIDAPDAVQKAVIEEQIVWMGGEQEKYGELIKQAKDIVRQYEENEKLKK